MTVYCPNCGKPNTDEATQCVGCATPLSKPTSKAGSRFKGTMMMSGLGTPAAPPAAAPPAGGAPPAEQKKNLAFQATMMGPMATPGQAGAPAPGAAAGAPPAGGPAAPAPGGFGAAPANPGPPAGAPAPAPGGFGAPTPAPAPATTGPMEGGFGAPAPAAGGFGAAPAGAPTPASPAPGGFGAPPAGDAPAPGGFGAPPAGDAPAAGGFGAPPAGAPAPGGFGAPPAGDAPAPGGFGAPPAAAGGFGSPPPSGGFGASAPGAPPASGGFGAPAGGPGAPAGGPGAPGGPGGFGGPPAGGPPGGAPPSGGGNKKMWIGIGVGCLLFAILACVGSYFYCKAKTEQFVDGMGEGLQQLGGELHRISLGMTLRSIQSSCTADPSGAAAATSFHPQAFAAYQGVACQVNQQTIDAVAHTCTPPQGQAVQRPCSTVQPVSQSGDAGRAVGVGLDPNLCYTFTSGSMRIVGCSVENDGFKIIHLENPAGVQ